MKLINKYLGGGYTPRFNNKGKPILDPNNSKDVKWLHELLAKRGAKAVHEGHLKFLEGSAERLAPIVIGASAPYMIMNPFTTIGSYAGGYIGGKIGNHFAGETGKYFGSLLGGFTGGWTGSLKDLLLKNYGKKVIVSKNINNAVKNTSQELLSNNRDYFGYYPDLSKNQIHQSETALAPIHSKTFQTLLPKPKAGELEFSPIITPPPANYVNKIQTNNSSIIKIPENLETVIASNREWLKKFNKWNRHYGYEPIPLNSSKDHKLMDKLIKERLILHNTFVRGVRDPSPKDLPKIKQILIDNNIEPTRDNILKYFAETIPPFTGHGRAGFHPLYPGLGALYGSNALNTASGYAKNGNDLGKVFTLLRPFDMSGTNRDQWVLNADFQFDNKLNSVLYNLYELPYLMRYGKSAKTQITKDRTIDYNKVLSLINKELSTDTQGKSRDDLLKIYSDLLPYNYSNLPYSVNFVGNPIKDFATIALLNRLSEIVPFDKYLSESALYGRYFNPLVLQSARKYNLLNNKQYPENIEVRVKPNSEDIPTVYIHSSDDFDDLGLFVPGKVIDEYPLENLRKIYEDINNEEIGRIFAPWTAKYYHKIAKGALKNAISTAIKNSKKVTPEELKQFVISEGIRPNKKPSNIITSEPTKATSRNHGNAYLHFIFTGPIGTKVVDAKELPIEEWVKYYGTRMHYGKASALLSRKSRKNGGKL